MLDEIIVEVDNKTSVFCDRKRISSDGILVYSEHGHETHESFFHFHYWCSARSATFHR